MISKNIKSVQSKQNTFNILYNLLAIKKNELHK
jgi:hypothetical protein